MKRILLTLVGLLIVGPIFGQMETKTTQSFTVSGEVKSVATIQASDLTKFMLHEIGDVVITNHLGEKKSEAKGLKGVLLKDVLSSVELNAENPKVLSEYYFVCRASDGYTIVYSWNELFNSATGNTAFIVTEKEGKSLAQMKDAILVITPSDSKTGRRHLKGLASIEIKRAR